MVIQNVHNNPGRFGYMKSGQPGMIMSGMQHQSRTAVVAFPNPLAQTIATFDADVIGAGGRLEFIFGLSDRVVNVSFPIDNTIAGDNAAITSAILLALQQEPRVNGYATFTATSTTGGIVLTSKGRFTGSSLSVQVQGVSASGAIIQPFATYSGSVQPIDKRMFVNSTAYPHPGLVVVAAPTPTDGVQTVSLPSSATDRVIGVVERRDPDVSAFLMSEMLEVMVEGDIRPWLENYATNDSNVPAYRHTADGEMSQLGGVVCVPAGDPVPTGCAFFPDRLNARFVRSKSDGTITLALGN